MQECVRDLEKNGHLIKIRTEINPDLEMAEVHRRIFDHKGPALLFENVKGSPFRAVSNIYGTFERTEFIFRKTLKRVGKVIELKADPTNFLKNVLSATSTRPSRPYRLFRSAGDFLSRSPMVRPRSTSCHR
jgi:4-hydroxy-3-polyprenylbenzoate decarboxylase